VLQFWNSADILVASIDPGANSAVRLPPGTGTFRIRIPFLGLAPGRYRVAGGFVQEDRFVGYLRTVAVLNVIDDGYTRYGGLAVMPVQISLPESSH
jgi:hypothetical protein